MSNLAHLLRPQTLADYFGQTHLVGPNQPLRKVIEDKHMFSMIFWGPAGVGKTSLAHIIANSQNRKLHALSAVSASKNDIRAIVQEREAQQELGEISLAPILFLDEIHRFNKAQQDYLLPFVEDGTLMLIGATTENPSFEVNGALLSRLKVFVLKPLSEIELGQLIDQTLNKLRVQPDSVLEITRDWLTTYAQGDARKLLTIIDNTHQLYGEITQESLEKTLQSNHISYDKKGEEHHNTISAFIKSMRAGNIDASLYYLARMVDAGEDPKFIARRMVVFASEDVGMAVPTALVVANEVFRACETIGYPECQINLAHGTAYLASCAKDRRAYDAYFLALADVKQYGGLPIPLQLRNAPTKLMKELNYGKGYEMYPEKQKGLLPEKLKGKKYFQ